MSDSNNNENLSQPNTIVVMRHSERIDQVIPNWLGNETTYKKIDLNMPASLPVQRCLQHYRYDSPITITGDAIARLSGRGLDLVNLVPDIIYCSPSLRCLQTASLVAQMSGSKALLRVEPMLYENTISYPNNIPHFLTKDEMKKLFPIDDSYVPLMPAEDLFKEHEPTSQYNFRINELIQRIAVFGEPFHKSSTTVLIVAHASTVDMVVGFLRSRPRMSSDEDLDKIGDKIPYCGTVTLRKKGRYWSPDYYAIPFNTNSMFTNRMNCKFLNRP